MRLSVTRRSDLALRALRTLAACGETMGGEALADAVGTSRGFLGQAMTPLVHAGWITSTPGPLGGYRLREGARPSVLAVIEAIEGRTDTGSCVLEPDATCAPTGGRRPCALHEAWMRAQRAMRAELVRTDAIPSTEVATLAVRLEVSDAT